MLEGEELVNPLASKAETDYPLEKFGGGGGEHPKPRAWR